MSEFNETIMASGADIDSAKFPASAETIRLVESALGASLGRQLKEYLMEFGYLGCGPIEFYGVNEMQKEKSDLVKTSQMLRNASGVLSGYVAIECIGDDLYAMCDSEDKMYKVVLADGVRVQPMNMNLLQYAVKRLNNQL